MGFAGFGALWRGGRACESDGGVIKIKLFGTRVSDGICRLRGPLAGGVGHAKVTEGSSKSSFLELASPMGVAWFGALWQGGRACESDAGVIKIKLFGTRVSDGICRLRGPLAGGSGMRK